MEQSRSRPIGTAVNKELNFSVKNKPQTIDYKNET